MSHCGCLAVASKNSEQKQLKQNRKKGSQRYLLELLSLQSSRVLLWLYISSRDSIPQGSRQTQQKGEVASPGSGKQKVFSKNLTIDPASISWQPRRRSGKEGWKRVSGGRQKCLWQHLAVWQYKWPSTGRCLLLLLKRKTAHSPTQVQVQAPVCFLTFPLEIRIQGMLAHNHLGN